MPDRKQLPSIAEAQRTPLVEQLLEQIEELLEENRRQAEQIQQLRAWGIDISVGQIDALLSSANDAFLAEKDHVKWRKASGGTRSDLGKRCRDGFASLKKTCRKLGISFRDYLGDRIRRHGNIAPLPDIIRERAAPASTVP